ncbi:MAG: LD-carboxypeptidase [Phycisphaerales bacterium]|nr:MAG: LD-carboxypeptidase [Phycisphaerales bacterium]
MAVDRVHLIAPAGSCRPFLEALGLDTAVQIMDLVQDVLGPSFAVTGDHELIEADEDEDHGGRQDDEHRARDIQMALADDQVVAVVGLRGGAWLTRVLPRIDFGVLDRRTRPIVMHGFSELTPLVNIVGAHPKGIGNYDMSPAFLAYGLRRQARERFCGGEGLRIDPDEWAAKRVCPEFESFIRDVGDMLSGQGSKRRITAHLVRGNLSTPTEVAFVGGNLVVFTTMVGSPFDRIARPTGQWLVLEEINEKPERIDRFLAHLTLAGYWESCGGILLGDFHIKDRPLTAAVVEILDYHLPSDSPIPILVTKNIGHIWPMSPLPLHSPVTIEETDRNVYGVRWPASATRVAGSI